MLLILIALAILFAAAALLVGVTGALFFEEPWRTGWEAAWDEPLLLAAYVVVAGLLAAK